MVRRATPPLELQLRSTRMRRTLLCVAPGMALGAPRLNPDATNPSEAGATSSVPEVHSNAPEDCPTEERFRLRLGEYLGRDVPATPTVTAARIDVRREAAEYRISLLVEQHGRWRSRALRTKSCAEAMDASALVIALAIDPSVATRVSSSPSSPSEQTSSAADTGPHHPSSECLWSDSTESPCDCPRQSPPPSRVELVAARLAIKPRYASSQRYTLSVHSGAQISYQQLPTAPLSVGLGASFDTSQLRLSVTAWLAQAVARQGAKGGDFSLVRAQVNACWVSPGRVGLGPCAGLSLGALTGEGIGVTVTQRATEVWWSSSFGAVLPYWHRDSALAGAFTWVELPGRRPSFQLSGSNFYRPPAVGLVGGVLVGLILN